MELKVFCEFERKRILVGVLKQEKGYFRFTYAKSWLYYKNQFSLGPDLPLRASPYESKKLFQGFSIRIPPRTSENYVRYCEERGISPTEKNELILLGSIGHKSTSSFVFELDHTSERQAHVLSTMMALVDEFSYDIVSAAFGITKTGLYKLLTKKIPAHRSSVYAILEICTFNPDAARWKISSSLGLPDTIKHKVMKKFTTEL